MPEKVELYPLRTPVIKPGDDLVGALVRAAGGAGGFKEGDVVVVSSKAVSSWQGRLLELGGISPSKRALSLARRSGLEPSFVEVVLREADRVLGCTRGAILTLKDGLLLANAGVDCSNVPPGKVSLLPANPPQTARRIAQEITRRTGARVGVIISDSTVRPMRKGTVGQALGWFLIGPVEDCRGRPDLFGRRLKITFRAVADQLATAAQLLMGEAGERVPAVLVRGAVRLGRGKHSPLIPARRCLYLSSLRVRV